MIEEPNDLNLSMEVKISTDQTAKFQGFSSENINRLATDGINSNNRDAREKFDNKS